MTLEDLPIDWSKIRLPGTPQYAPDPPENPHQPSGPSLDTLLIQKTRVIKTKMEAVASAIRERLTIRTHNLTRIGEDQDRATLMLNYLGRSANYQTRQHKEKGVFYQKIFDLGKERRSQDTDCWRDIVLVLRDLLTFWDEYEHSKARGAFLADVGQ